MAEPWPWDQRPDCAVITERAIVEDGAPILHVTHDLDDHGWQFLGGGYVDVDKVVAVCLHCIPQLDPSVLGLSDLPPGWYAWRRLKSEPWTREPNANVQTDKGSHSPPFELGLIDSINAAATSGTGMACGLPPTSSGCSSRCFK
jgi:hypothetical protein